MRCVDCSDVERPLFQYCEMDTHSAYIALAGDTIDDIVMPDPSGCRPNAATSTKTTTSRLVSSDSRGQPPRRVASRARRTTRGHPVYLRPSGVTTDSFDCVVRPTTVLVPSLSTARRASASVRRPSTKTPFSR